jgi:hypothetical protein
MKPGVSEPPSALHCPCGADQFTTVHTYLAPPEGSAPALRRPTATASCIAAAVRSLHPVFQLAADLWRCHVDATCSDAAGILRTYERILALAPERSDTAGWRT